MFGEFHVQQRERVALTVERRTPGDFKAVVAIKAAGVAGTFPGSRPAELKAAFRAMLHWPPEGKRGQSEWK